MSVDINLSWRLRAGWSKWTLGRELTEGRGGGCGGGDDRVGVYMRMSMSTVGVGVGVCMMG